ncbi:MAG TPA: DUF4019 domain-containing protein [Burkholderiaceae bacterium]|jgi:hypothetical protein|nr:DUF4019 domain-containing protein [Burkholderiaceae bacterium]
MTLRLLTILLTIFGATAGAQPKLPPPSGPGASVTMPSEDSSTAFRELAAQTAGERWLVLLDRGEYAKAWEECAQLFRQRVTREQWVDSLPATRGSFGPVRSRKVEVAAYKTSLPGAPDGQYVTVRYRTSFEMKDGAEELLTLAFEDGLWRPTGYLIR